MPRTKSASRAFLLIYAGSTAFAAAALLLYSWRFLGHGSWTESIGTAIFVVFLILSNLTLSGLALWLARGSAEFIPAGLQKGDLLLLSPLLAYAATIVPYSLLIVAGMMPGLSRELSQAAWVAMVALLAPFVASVLFAGPYSIFFLVRSSVGRLPISRWQIAACLSNLAFLIALGTLPALTL